jgi:hypothetical protein
MHYSQELFPEKKGLPVPTSDDHPHSSENSYIDMEDDVSEEQPPFLWTWTSHHHDFGD